MARQPKAAAERVSNIDSEKMYRVKLKRAVRIGKFGEMLLSPKADNMVKGYVLASLSADDYESYEAV